MYTNPIVSAELNLVKEYGRCHHGNCRAHMRIPDSTGYMAHNARHDYHSASVT